MKSFFIFFLAFLQGSLTIAQNKLYDHNNVNWLQVVQTSKLNNKLSLHLEYNNRRTEGIKNYQQQLIRIGINYKQDDKLLLHIGYANVLTFTYGDYPIAANGNFVEHRLYEQINLKQNYQRLQILQRLRVEQRWVAVLNAQGNFEKWNFLHRFRYLIRNQLPLKKDFYLAATDEIFIGAGKNLGVNIFDQNRLQLAIGKKMSKKINVELGYFNQVIQQGKLVNNKLVLQKNNGLIFIIATSF